MLSTDQSLEPSLPKLSYGSVWLVGAADGYLRHLSRLAVHALSTADAVIHDSGIVQDILDLVKPPGYREVASAGRATERVIKLAEDGWRVVQLVNGDVIERAVESAIRCADRNIPFRIVLSADDPIGDGSPLGLILVRKTLSVGGADAHLVDRNPAVGCGSGDRPTAMAAGFFDVGSRRLGNRRMKCKA